MESSQNFQSFFIRDQLCNSEIDTIEDLVDFQNTNGPIPGLELDVFSCCQRKYIF